MNIHFKYLLGSIIQDLEDAFLDKEDTIKIEALNEIKSFANDLIDWSNIKLSYINKD